MTLVRWLAFGGLVVALILIVIGGVIHRWNGGDHG
jgi:hypothetical protein